MASMNDNFRKRASNIYHGILKEEYWDRESAKRVEKLKLLAKRDVIITESNKGQPGIIKSLLDSGADPNHIPGLDPGYDNYWTWENPLNAALDAKSEDNNRLATIKLLLDSGACVNYMRLNDSYTPLQVALNKRFVRIAQLLLEYNADPDKSNNGFTSLNRIVRGLCYAWCNEYVAMEQSKFEQFKIEAVKLLVSYGADITIKNPAGYSALDYAEEKETFPAMAELILSL